MDLNKIDNLLNNIEKEFAGKNLDSLGNNVDDKAKKEGDAIRAMSRMVGRPMFKSKQSTKPHHTSVWQTLPPNAKEAIGQVCSTGL